MQLGIMANGTDVLLAYYSSDMWFEGWARVLSFATVMGPRVGQGDHLFGSVGMI